VLPLALDALSLTLRDVVDDDSRWVGEGLRQKGLIADHTTAPQILLAGGSNVNYGYSAAQIEREFGVPATNLAVHAGLGRRYIFWDCLRHAKRGDLVVLGLEYALYGHLFRDPAERYQVFIYDRAYYEQLPWIEKVILLGSMSPGDWSKLLRAKAGWRKPKASLSLLVLSQRGDQTDNTEPDVRLQEGPPFEGVVGPEFTGDLRDFAKAVRERGAVVALVFPNLRDAEFRRRIKPGFLADIHQAADAAGVRVVGTPESSAFPTQYAYNTNYHLNAEGTRIATRRLMRELAEAGARLPAHPSR